MKKKFICLIFTCIIIIQFLNAEILDSDIEVFKNMVQNSMFDDVIMLLEDSIKQNPNYAKLDEVIYLLAESYYGIDKYEESLKNYKIIIEKYQSSKYYDKALYKIGEVNFRLNNTDEAINYLLEFSKKYPDSDLINRTNYFLGELFIKKNNFEEALKYLEPLSKKFNDELYYNANYSLGWVYFNLKQYEKSIVAYKNLEGKKEFDDVGIHIGQAYLKLGDLEKAKKYLSSIDMNSEDYILSLYNQTQIYQKNGNITEYIKTVRTMNEKFPKNDMTIEVNFNLANLLYDKNDYENSIIYFENVLKNGNSKSENSLIKALLETSYYFSGYINQLLYFNKKDKNDYFNKATVYYKKYLNDYPEGKYFNKTLFRLGEIYSEHNEPDNSIKYYNLVNDKTLIDKSLFEIARQLFKSHRTEEAINYLLRIKKEVPESPLLVETNFLIAEYYFNKKDFKNALNYYNEILSSKEEKNIFYEDSYYKKGWALSELSRYDEALETFEGFLKEFSSSKYKTSIQYQMSKIYFDKKDYENSEKILKTIESSIPEEEIKKYNNLAVIKTLQAEKTESSNMANALLLYEEAAANYLQAKNDEEYINLKIKIADLYFKQNNFNNVISIYQELLNKYPDNKQTIYFYHGLGWGYYKSNDYKNAIDAFNKFIEKYKISDGSVKDNLLYEEALLLIGESHYALKDLVRAEKYYNQYLAEFPKGRYANDIMIKQSKVVAVNKDPKEALKLLIDKYYDLEKSSEPAQREEITLNICLTYFEIGGLSEYLHWSEIYLNNYKNSSYVKIIKYNQIISFYKLNRAEEAIKSATDFLTENSDFDKNDQLYFLIGTVKYNNKEYLDALFNFKKLFSGYPKSDKIEEGYYLSSLSSYNLKDYSLTIEYINKLLSQFPETKFKREILFYKIMSLSELNMNTEIFEIADNLINSETDILIKIKVIYFKAKALAATDKNNESINLLNESVKLYSDAEKDKKIKDDDIIARILMLLAEVYVKIEKPVYAVLQYGRIISNYPFENYVDIAAFSNAKLYIQMNKKETAITLLEKFIADFPDSKYIDEAKNLLAQLK